MPRRKRPTEPPEEPEDDDEELEDEDDEESSDADDDESDDDESDDEDEAEDDDEDDEIDLDEDGDADADDEAADDSDAARACSNGSSKPVPDEDGEPRRSRADRRRGRFARGPGGMGRPSTGPPLRQRLQSGQSGQSGQSTEDGDAVSAAEASGAPPPETEMAPDISSWPGTAEAAKIAGRHTSTIKLWRAQGRIRAIQDGAGCWRHHPDDLAESLDTPDQVDPGSVLASGMSAIVAQGASANERLLAMTEIATSGLKDATGVLSAELKRAYERIAILDKTNAELRAVNNAVHSDDLKHERYMRRLEHKHELDVTGAKETSARIEGLLSIVGPIAASIGARLIGLDGKALELERKATGTAPTEPSPPPKEDDRLLSFEAKMTNAMARLCDALRKLEGPAFQGLRAMMPPNVQSALDDVLTNASDSVVGQALAVLVRAAQNLSDLQFQTLRPITPVDVANALAELRTLIKNAEAQNAATSKEGS